MDNTLLLRSSHLRYCGDEAIPPFRHCKERSDEAMTTETPRHYKERSNPEYVTLY
jgi:hypothetical protein